MTAKERARLEQLKRLEQLAALQQQVRNHVERKNGCWIWTGPKSWNPKYPSRTYGYITLERSKVSARRASYLAFGIEPPMGNHVVGCTCGERLCVNPKHLFLKDKLKTTGRKKNA